MRVQTTLDSGAQQTHKGNVKQNFPTIYCYIFLQEIQGGVYSNLSKPLKKH